MSNPPLVDPAAVSRVLMVRPRFLGDVCLTLPALDAIRTACPRARVAYLVERDSAPLLEGDPRVDTLITVPRHPDAGATLALVGRLRAFAPEVAFDFFCNPRTALWTRASGARFRVGYPNKGWRSALYTHHARPRTLSAIVQPSDNAKVSLDPGLVETLLDDHLQGSVEQLLTTLRRGKSRRVRSPRCPIP